MDQIQQPAQQPAQPVQNPINQIQQIVMPILTSNAIHVFQSNDQNRGSTIQNINNTYSQGQGVLPNNLKGAVLVDATNGVDLEFISSDSSIITKSAQEITNQITKMLPGWSGQATQVSSPAYVSWKDSAGKANPLYTATLTLFQQQQSQPVQEELIRIKHLIKVL